MYDTKMRMPHVFEVERLLKKHFPENRYALIHQKNATSGVLDYYLEGSSKPIKLKNEENAQRLLLQEIKNGANIFVSVNTKYGNSMIELKEKKEFKKLLNEVGTSVFETDHFVIFDLTKSDKLY